MDKNKEIQSWLDGPRDYDAGCQLYNKHGRNRNLQRSFSKKNKYTEEKLAYELAKLIGLSSVPEKSKALDDLAAAANASQTHLAKFTGNMAGHPKDPPVTAAKKAEEPEQPDEGATTEAAQEPVADTPPAAGEKSLKEINDEAIKLSEAIKNDLAPGTTEYNDEMAKLKKLQAIINDHNRQLSNTGQEENQEEAGQQTPGEETEGATEDQGTPASSNNELQERPEAEAATEPAAAPVADTPTDTDKKSDDQPENQEEVEKSLFPGKEAPKEILSIWEAYTKAHDLRKVAKGKLLALDGGAEQDAKRQTLAEEIVTLRETIKQAYDLLAAYRDKGELPATTTQQIAKATDGVKYPATLPKDLDLKDAAKVQRRITTVKANRSRDNKKGKDVGRWEIELEFLEKVLDGTIQLD